MCISEPTSGPRAVSVCRSACLTRSGVEQHHRNAGSGGQRMAAGCTFAAELNQKNRFQDCLIFHCYLKRCLEDAETPPIAHNSFRWFASVCVIEDFGHVRDPLAYVHEWMQHCMHIHESWLHLPPGPDVGNSDDLWPYSRSCENAVNALNLCKI